MQKSLAVLSMSVRTNSSNAEFAGSRKTANASAMAAQDIPAHVSTAEPGSLQANRRRLKIGGHSHSSGLNRDYARCDRQHDQHIDTELRRNTALQVETVLISK